MQQGATYLLCARELSTCLGLDSLALSPMGSSSRPRRVSGSPVGSLPLRPSRSARRTRLAFCTGRAGGWGRKLSCRFCHWAALLTYSIVVISSIAQDVICHDWSADCQLPIVL